MGFASSSAGGAAGGGGGGGRNIVFRGRVYFDLLGEVRDGSEMSTGGGWLSSLSSSSSSSSSLPARSMSRDGFRCGFLPSGGGGTVVVASAVGAAAAAVSSTSGGSSSSEACCGCFAIASFSIANAFVDSSSALIRAVALSTEMSSSSSRASAFMPSSSTGCGDAPEARSISTSSAHGSIAACMSGVRFRSAVRTRNALATAPLPVSLSLCRMARTASTCLPSTASVNGVSPQLDRTFRAAPEAIRIDTHW